MACTSTGVVEGRSKDAGKGRKEISTDGIRRTGKVAADGVDISSTSGARHSNVLCRNRGGDSDDIPTGTV